MKATVEIPSYPQKVALITSEKGATSDIKNVLNRRARVLRSIYSHLLFKERKQNRVYKQLKSDKRNSTTI